MKTLDATRRLFGAPPPDPGDAQKPPALDSREPGVRTYPSDPPAGISDPYDDALAVAKVRTPFAGCVVVFTGKAERPRAELTALAVAADAMVENRVTAWTTYLIAADPRESSVKLNRARSYETTVISVEEFYGMVIHGR